MKQGRGDGLMGAENGQRNGSRPSISLATSLAMTVFSSWSVRPSFSYLILPIFACHAPEYSYTKSDGDFLGLWSVIYRTRLFDDSWVVSSLWMNTVARSVEASLSAWDFGDISCESSLLLDCCMYSAKEKILIPDTVYVQSRSPYRRHHR